VPVKTKKTGSKKKGHFEGKCPVSLPNLRRIHNKYDNVYNAVPVPTVFAYIGTSSDRESNT